MSMPAVTKHLKVLRQAGLITQTRQGQWRPCKLAPQPLREVADWVDQYRQLWEARFDSLEEYLLGLQQASVRQGPDHGSE
jgi:DNA-binding transcriptional ArsR family regulator